MSLGRVIKGFLLEVRPPVMMAAIFAGWLGGFLAYNTDLTRLLLYSFCVFLALYCAHLKDTYVDFFVRKEYDLGYVSRFKDAGGILERRHFLLGLLFSSLFFVIVAFYLAVVSSYVFLPIAFGGWLIAVGYVPYLDKHWFTVSTSYPAGVSLALLGGYVVQTGFVAVSSVALCLSVWLIIIGVKVVDDLPDIEGDLALSKKTLPTTLGFEVAKQVAYILMCGGLGLAALLSIYGILPLAVVYSAVAASPIFLYSWRMNPRRAIFVLIAGCYVLMLLTIGLLVI